MAEPALRTVSRRIAPRLSRRLAGGVLVVYTLFVLVVTLTPRAPGAGVVRRTVDAFIDWLAGLGIAGIDFLDIEFLGNILMFVPLGALVALLLPRRLWWTLLVMGTAFSGFIEAYQGAFLPERFSEWRDIASNTLGFLIGSAITTVLVVRRSRTERA